MDKLNNPPFKRSLNDKKEIQTSKTYDYSIVRLMEKFNISAEEAENIIYKLTEKQEVKENRINDKQQKPKEEVNVVYMESRSNIQTDPMEPKQDLIYESKPKIRPSPTIQNKPKKKIKNDNPNEEKIDEEPKTNVDLIISDMIPDYKKEISIELNNVDLIFEVETDKIDTLKESFIRTLKRNKTKKTKFQALTDITFKINKGEKVGIIGYNGAGKSTLLKVITGIYPPNKGTVKTYGRISPLLSLGAGFDSNYSGRKNIYLNGAVLGYSKEFIESKEKEIIEFSELGEFIDFPIKNYSSGMLSKLGFSIATIVEPDILIIDEILGVGDVNFKRKSSDKIKSLMDGGTTVLLVSHSIPQIRELCEKAIWVDKGRIREIGAVNTVCDHYLKDSEKASNKQIANIEFR